MTHQLKAEKLIEKPASEVFRALKDGRLFLNCGAGSNTLKIDFRVGGKYHVTFTNHKVSNFGEFLEIIPDKKIVFSWCQTFGAEQKPDTQVTIELFPDGNKTRLALLHTGFQTAENRDDHQQGWTGGITDFADEIQNGRLRMIRNFPVSVEKLFEMCKNPASFENKGKIGETVPNQKITMSSSVGQVTLSFKQKDDTVSSLEIIHDGLRTDEDQKSHRVNWDTITSKMSQKFAT